MATLSFSRLSTRSFRLGAVAAVAAFGMVTPLALAQTPMASPEAEMAAGHPAHIHSGTCAELGDVVVPLSDVGMPGMGDMMGEMMGGGSPVPIMTSHTWVDVPLADIISGGHAINVHESAEAIDVYIACGDIAGMVMEGEEGEMELLIGLGELNDSGYSGVAWLGADGDRTEVVITLLDHDGE